MRIVENITAWDEVKNQVYFHGCPNINYAINIAKDGFIRVKPEQERHYLASVKGQAYVTNEVYKAYEMAFNGNITDKLRFLSDRYFSQKTYNKQICIYRERLEKQGRYGFIFLIDGNDLNKVQPDEDDVGELIYTLEYSDYISISLKERFYWLLELVYDVAYNFLVKMPQLHKGKAYAMMGKRILPHLTDEQKQQILEYSEYYNVSVGHNIPIQDYCYYFDKFYDSQEIENRRDIPENLHLIKINKIQDLLYNAFDIQDLG